MNNVMGTLSILDSDHAIIASEIMGRRRSKNIYKIYLITANPHVLCLTQYYNILLVYEKRILPAKEVMQA